MWDLYANLEELCETTANELKGANDKIRAAGGKVSPSDLEYLDKIAHLLKSVKTTMAMMDAEGGSNATYADMPHRSSYARKRDSMGRFSRADGMMGRTYADHAYDSGMMAELRELMEDAPDEQTRQKFQRFINELGQR